MNGRRLQTEHIRTPTIIQVRVLSCYAFNALEFLSKMHLNAVLRSAEEKVKRMINEVKPTGNR